MTASSTALVVVGPSGVGSFHSRLWRVSPNNAQLVEGGTRGPYFLVGASAQEFIIRIEPFDSETVARATVLLVAILAGNEGGLEVLRMSENLISTPRGERVAEFWELADDTLELLLNELRRSTRVGIVELDLPSLLNREVLHLLNEYGVDVSFFGEIRNTTKSVKATA